MRRLEGLDSLPRDLASNVRHLKETASVPVCVGFGVSTPQQAAAVASVADGVIVGSAIVRVIDRIAREDPAAVPAEVGRFVEPLAAATKG